MLKRVLSSILVAGLVTVATPGVSQAAVSDTPAVGFPSFDGTVNAISHRGSTIYVGGSFNEVTDADGTSFARNNAAAVDARTGAVLPWNPRVSGEVRELKAAKEGVYLVGRFTTVKGKARRHVARVALGGGGKLSPKFNVNPNLPVNAIALSKGRVFLGGVFTTFNGAERTRLAALTRKGPTRLTPWRPKAQNGVVLDMVRSKAGVYVAGEFRTLNGQADYQRLALIRQTKAGSLVKKFDPRTNAVILDISVTRTRVYAAVGGPRGGAAMSIGAGKGSTKWERRFDGDVQAVVAMQGRVYLGGHFFHICNPGGQQVDGVCNTGSQERAHGASVIPKTGRLAEWHPRLNGELGINAFDKYASADRLLVGGDFTTANGGATPVRRFAVFN
jgi:hypothetical protein